MPQRGRIVVFEPAGHKPPPAIEAFYQAARPVLSTGGDPLALDSVRHYFSELYFQKGYDALDAAKLDGVCYPILPEIENTARKLAFPFARIAQAFRLIDDVMEPLLVPFDDDAKTALDALKYAPLPPPGVLRKLQQYVVPVPKKIRGALLAVGAARAINEKIYGDRFVRLDTMNLYHPQSGLDWSDPTFRSAESNMF